MLNKKRLLVIGIIMMLFVTGCGNADQEKKESKPTEESSSKSEKDDDASEDEVDENDEVSVDDSE